jgi:hypothetical protein
MMSGTKCAREPKKERNEERTEEIENRKSQIANLRAWPICDLRFSIVNFQCPSSTPATPS